MECELLKDCSFYNDKMPIDRGLGHMQKQKYCIGDNSSCARYKVATTIGISNVPTNLYPVMKERAEKILAEFKCQQKSRL